jgi:uncharacterized iron-regulated membrane protein
MMGDRRNRNYAHAIHIGIGLAAVLLVLFTAFTGIILNHRDDLSLHEQYPSNTLVLWLYGFHMEDETDGNYVNIPPTWEKTITAFHGWRFFGKSFGLLADATAVVIMLQSITGLYLWIKRKLSNRQPQCTVTTRITPNKGVMNTDCMVTGLYDTHENVSYDKPFERRGSKC